MLRLDVEVAMPAPGRSIVLDDLPDSISGEFFRNLGGLALRFLSTTSRSQLANQCPSIAHSSGPASDIHFLQRDDELLRSISALVQGAFGRQLIVNWGGGPQVWSHVGDDPPRNPGEDRVSTRYLTELDRLPRLDAEGDGIRSFVGLLLAAEVASHPILVIDEPETFLHPPQARRLGAVLAESAEAGKRQVIVATHSSDVVRGAMDASRNVLVCRMVREGSINRVSVLGRSELQDLWLKPLLRSSIAIDGLFHSGVVVCEGDSDCRFYEALAMRVEEESLRPLDLYFVHGGGKGAIATLAHTYKALSVPTVVIADVDLLRKKEEFSKLFETLGGDLQAISSLYNRVVAALNDRKPLVSASDLVGRVEAVLSRVKEAGRVTVTDRRQIQDALEAASDWSEVKRYGINRLRGEELTAGKGLLAKCREVGLFLAPVGVLEGWWAEGPSDKAEWVARAIPKMSESPETFQEASSFVAEVCESLAGR
jgi:hypothetical protein